MKKIISVIIVMFTFNTSALASQFCDGFEAGFAVGYKKVKGGYAFAGLPPICPIQPIKGYGEWDLSDFEHGFNVAKDKVRDDYYAHNMRVVMLYFFEQCLYGKKPSSEVSCD